MACILFAQIFFSYKEQIETTIVLSVYSHTLLVFINIIIITVQFIKILNFPFNEKFRNNIKILKI